MNKPSMAYPLFASATYTFAPGKYPLLESGEVAFTRYEANGLTASGAFVRHTSSITQNRVTMLYRGLTHAELESFLKEDQTGFFNVVAGGEFEYKHTDGVIYKARFLSTSVASSPGTGGLYDITPLELLLS